MLEDCNRSAVTLESNATSLIKSQEQCHCLALDCVNELHTFHDCSQSSPNAHNELPDVVIWVKPSTRLENNERDAAVNRIHPQHVAPKLRLEPDFGPFKIIEETSSDEQHALPIRSSSCEALFPPL